MNTEDKQLSSIYKQAKQEIPAEHIDDAILAAAKRETKKFSLPYNPFSNTWRVSASLAAVLILSFGIVTLIEDVEDEFTLDGVTPLIIEETESRQLPANNVEKRRALAKAPSTARAKSSLQQPAAKSLSDTSNAEMTHDLLSFREQDKKRNEQLARKNKQEAQRTKLQTESTDQISLSPALPLSSPSTITTGIDEQAMLPYWQYKDEGMSIRLIQRLPDQTRGYFIARGFSAKHAELIAQSCVFQTVFKNTSNTGEPSAIVYNMENWVVSHNGKSGGMKTREKWAMQWQELNVPAAAKLAFEWGLLPTRQDYQPGDYNWGMAIFDLAPADNFNLKITWQQHNEQHSVIIPKMLCAADIHADPEAP